MNKSDFYYFLPEEQIAQTPASPRDSARLLVYDRKTKQTEHKIFRDILSYLKKGDVMVINNTKVLPARIFATRESGPAVIEVLLLKRLSYTNWDVIMKPAKKVKLGTVLTFSNDLKAKMVKIKDDGVRELEFIFDGVFEDILDRIGTMPLPPYITKKLDDQTEYQTVYSKVTGSAAAPTAGLHFTDELLSKIKDMGVEILEVNLNIGLGTFRPVKEDNILDHKMHVESYSISSEVADKITKAKSEGRRVIAVGTTSVRVLEAASESKGVIKGKSGDTDIFIYPGYDFKIVDALITNFHLPESTLIMLVSAFMGREETLSMYNLAVKEGYRFFSFGDACLIL
ncbi:MAG: tRNA preQ1(34) S-adenosylmethionine ribosyltransferase-isomerase QueA [Clostridia bacterium]|nr:tRNA preQ1(34) S-adenosylmethionine ribosyltransferase-isomerase QueA [Clostridia bacterium]MDY5264683.1 tRNA preQ1(34) S-adenosylmethionine ribosyltransferase-isomerase QueA [Eubacteriales bacterium]MDY5439695.1 tRNA preQ1(34) S-adenosylmethionine ribosyltransferase-isomerase QueA [Eubacteriales bacterium]